MKIIKVEDLQLGDEIVIASGSKLKTLIVVKKPEVRATYSNGDYYKAVRCTSKAIITEFPRKRYDYTTKAHIDYTHKVKNWVHSFEDHNMRISVDMNYKDIWLIKRNGIEV